MIQNNNNSACCSGDSGCCGSKQGDAGDGRRMTIDFLYLDLSVCTRCQDTDTSLDVALAEVLGVLNATGIKVTLNKINVTSEELAIKYKFASSPTIRVNGRDIQMEVKENRCESCGDLCGDEVDCRVWVYHGKEYTVPPKAMIMEAILKAVYGAQDADEIARTEYKLPENLKRFYTAFESKQKNIRTC
jgi:hypothetical protein